MEDRQKGPQSLEGVRRDLHDHSVPGGDGMAMPMDIAWGVAARMNQLGLRVKEMAGRFQSLATIEEMVGTGLRQPVLMSLAPDRFW